MNFRKNKGIASNISGYRTYSISRDYGEQKIEILFDKLAVVDTGTTAEIADKVIIDELADKVFNISYGSKSRYVELPKKIVFSYKDESEQSSTVATNSENNDKVDVKTEMIRSTVPSWSLDDVYLEEKTRQQIDTTLTILKNRDKLFNEWKIKGNNSSGRAVILNFFGPPGTGKSMAAEAIANYIGKKISIVNYAELESKYVGDTPKNIAKVFSEARENDSVILFDEADSFLGKRLTNVTQAADYGVNVTRSVMLMEIERFDGVIIFTTNLINNYDEAFKRRILANIEFGIPDVEGRKKIWKTHLPSSVPLSRDVSIERLANEFENITGADIKDIVLYAAVRCLQYGNDCINFEDFETAYKYVIDRYKGNSPQNVSATSRIITQEEYDKIQFESGAING